MSVAVVRFPGSLDHDSAVRAVERLGGRATYAWHADAELPPETTAVLLPGGFSYGDHLRCGAIASRAPIMAAVRRHAEAGGPVIGICNGFQVLTRTGLLPGALGHNAGGEFDCRWVVLGVERSPCVWTKGIEDPIHCPIAHGEGRYVHPDPASLAEGGQVALRYRSTNPNGSVADIAGVCDSSGVVLGLMPHPENHIVPRQHPRHARGGGGPAHLGLRLFQNGVRHAKAL
jgi:phosphoribosylformylglycinamidine synthase subunit PurQ / glutaminase